MSEIHWAKHVTGAFGTASNWTGHVVPGAGDDAILDAAGTTAYYVAATTTETVASLQTNATATLTVRVGAGAGGFTATGGSGSGANAGTIAIADAGDFIFGGTIDNAGKITLGSTGDATQLGLSAAGTLSGAGEVTLTDNANNQIAATAAATLTNVNNTVSGAGTIGGGGLTLDNEAAGVIDASGAKNALILDTGANTITNAGVIETTGAGGLVVDSTIHNAGGSIEVLDGSTLSFNDGAVIDGGALLAGAGTHLVLSSSDLNYVTLKTQGSGTIQISGGSLTGVINQANIGVAAGTDLYVSGYLNNAGTISLITDNNGGENGTQIVLTGSTVLEGGGRIVMGGTTPWANYIDGQASGFTLTNVNETIEGAGNIGDTGLGTGPLTLVNDASGVIDADYANQLIINTGGITTVTNYGLLEGTGKAGLALDAAVENLGGGQIRAGSGSLVDLNGVAVTGGVLTTNGTGVIDAVGLATLVNVDSKGALAANDGDAFVVAGTMTNSGVITLAAGGHGATLGMAGVVTLTGGGKVNMVDTGGAPNANAIAGDFYDQGGSLINVNNTISGAGSIGNGGVGGAVLAAFTNDAAGVIDASDASTVLQITAVSGLITNAGLFEGTGTAGLVITGGAIHNAGGTILAANGSQVVLNNNASVTGGTVNSAGSGVVNVVAAAFTNVANKGNIELNDGSALYLGGSTLVNSGDIALSGSNHGANFLVSTAALYLSGAGTISLNGPTSWNNDISANASGDKLVNVNNTITGGGTIGGDNLVFVNDAGGVVDGSDASTTPATLTFADGSGSVINQGLIEGTSASGVTFTSTTVNNAGGTILAATGSQIVLNGATLDGGVLTSAGTGVVNVASATLSNVTNKASVSLVDGSALYLSGALTNSGVITVAGGGHGGNIFQSSSKLTLSGGGTVTLTGTGPWNNDISGTASGDTLTNVDNTITGGGSIGGNNLVLINDAKGVIDGSSQYGTLTLDNGSASGGVAMTNKGLIEGTGSGSLTITNTIIENAGGTILAATGSAIALNGAAIVGGSVRTEGSGVIDVNGGGNSASDVTLGANVQVLDGDVLYLGGAVKNTGVITVQGAGHGGGLSISGAVTLSGSGSIAIGGASPWNSSIGGASSAAILTNDSTIVGEGHISVTLVNGASGVIDAKGPGVNYGLDLDSNSTTISNAGLMEATTGGGLNINTAVNNTSTGKIEANSGAVHVSVALSNAGLMEATGSGTLYIAAGVTDTGAGKIESHGGTVQVSAGVSGGLTIDGGVMDLTLSGASNDVAFLGAGKLELNQSQSYAGSVSGLSKTGINSLDLTDIGFVSASEATFVENKAGTSGVLTVTNGSATARITLIGDYSASTFVTKNDGSGGTKVVGSTAPAGASVIAPAHAFIGAMAAFSADTGAAVSTPVQSLRSDLPLLAASGRGMA